jgi:hypothetical protein
MTGKPRTVQRVFIGVFCTLIALPLLTGSWRGGASALTENRLRASLPQVQLLLDDSRAYFKALESWFDDRFGLRRTLVEWHNRLKYFALGVSSTPDVIAGRDGWLYWAQQADGDAIDYWRGARTLARDELAAMRAQLQARTDRLASRGVGYVYFIAPDKHSIYPEFLPASVTRVRERSRLDQFMDYIARHDSLTVVDPRPALRNARSHWPVYHRTDTHWNAYGAYAGYLSLMTVLQRRYPELAALQLSPDDFREAPGAWPYVAPAMRFPAPDTAPSGTAAPGGDLAKMIGLEGILRDTSVVPRAAARRCARVVATPHRPDRLDKEGPDPRLGHVGLMTTRCEDKPLRVLVLHDSFGPLMMPYLSETFGQVTYVWANNYFQFAEALADLGAVDLVIEEQVERHLLPDYIY